MPSKFLEIEIPEKISTNKIYSGVHYSVRKRHKDLFGWPVKVALRKDDRKQIKTQLVDLDFDFHFAKRPLDSSNTSYMAKIIEDWLVKLEVLPGDTIKTVRRVTLRSEKGEKNSDVCFLSIREIGKDG